MKTNVCDLMITDLLTAHFEDSLDDVYNTMMENNIRHLPVIDDHKKLVGIISERDIERAMISIVSHDDRGRRLEDFEFPKDQNVSDYMTTTVVTLPLNCRIIDAIHTLRKKKISSVVCVHQNYVKGIITTDDLLALLAKILEEDEGNKFQTVPLESFFDDSWMTATA